MITETDAHEFAESFVGIVNPDVTIQVREDAGGNVYIVELTSEVVVFVNAEGNCEYLN